MPKKRAKNSFLLLDLNQKKFWIRDKKIVVKDEHKKVVYILMINFNCSCEIEEKNFFVMEKYYSSRALNSFHPRASNKIFQIFFKNFTFFLPKNKFLNLWTKILASQLDMSKKHDRWRDLKFKKTSTENLVWLRTINESFRLD